MLYFAYPKGNLYIEQVLGSFFKYLHKNFLRINEEFKGDQEESKERQVVCDEIAITHYTYFTEAQKKAIYDACTIAQIRNPYLVRESAATVAHYAYEQKNEMIRVRESEETKEIERIVAFIDIGHTQTSVTFAKYELKSDDKLCVTIMQENSD